MRIPAPIPSPRRSFIEAVLTLVLLALIGTAYLSNRGFVSVHPPSYYGLQVAAFAQGRLDVPVKGDDAFYRLDNPYAGPQGTSRPHDMSYYGGRFYIYYGTTPVLLLGLPWHLLFGSYLTEAGLVGLSCFIGVATLSLWLIRLRKRLVPTCAFGWVALGILLLGFGSPVFFLTTNYTFYAVPIAGAFLCLAGAVFAASEAVVARHGFSDLCWLAACSLALGLAVGARPIYVMSVPMALVPMIALWARLPRTEKRGRQALVLVVAAIVPAAAVGVAIAWHNFARFDDPLDFGIRFSLASGDLREAHLVGPEFIPKNLRLYLLEAAEFIRFYPFLHTNARPFGVLPHLTFVAVASLFPLTLLARPMRRAEWIVPGIVLLGSCAANLALLCLFFGGEDRYLVDFAPAALALGAACTVGLAGSAHIQANWTRTALLGVIGLIALWTIGNGVGFGVSQQPATPFHAWLERSSNRVAARLENILGAAYGPLEMDVVFTPTPGVRDPLLSTGNLRGTGDILYVTYPDAASAQFGFFHLGAGGPVGQPVPIVSGKTYRVRIEIGSLYPPAFHPRFKGWAEEQVSWLKRDLKVLIDGRVVLQARADLYTSTPEGVRPGENTLASDVSAKSFSGRILAVRRTAFPPAPRLDLLSQGGPVRLRLRLPPAPNEHFLPLIATGRATAGDLISVQLATDGTVRFQHDCWGGGGLISDPVVLPEQDEHVLDVDMPSLYPVPQAGPLVTGRLRIRLNGKVIIDTERSFNPARPGECDFGYNALGAGSAQGMFTGTIVEITRLPAW